MNCRHCGKPIRKGEEGVNWPWIHESGWYQCARVAGFSTKAEPEDEWENEPRVDRAGGSEYKSEEDGWYEQEALTRWRTDHPDDRRSDEQIRRS